MSATPRAETHCRIEGPAYVRALEFKAFLFPLVATATAELPAPPGAGWRDSARHGTLLHYAPGRFLAPAPTPEMARHLAALESAGVGCVFDVSGQWRALSLAGPGAAALLRAGADVDSMLAHRDCAALTLLECPVVLARAGEGFDLWVQASYASALRATFGRLCAPSQPG